MTEHNATARNAGLNGAGLFPARPSRAFSRAFSRARQRLPALVLALALTGLSTQASAHARLARATPAAHSTLAAAPDAVTIWLTQDIEPAFSTITVRDASGKTIDKGDSHLDAGHRKTLKVSLSEIPPGTYTVMWRVLSIDSHKSEGEFTFRISR